MNAADHCPSDGSTLLGSNATVAAGPKAPANKVKCVILSQLFYPEEAATGQLLTELAVAMAEYGVEVSAIAGQPTYFHYGKAPADMKHGGVCVHRPPCTWFRKRFLAGRLLNILSFGIGLFGHLMLTRPRGPFLIVTNPPFLPLFGLICKKIYKSPYIVLVHDVYPDLLPRFGLCRDKGLVVRIWDWLNTKIYGNADAIIVLGREMANVMARKDPRPNASSRIHVIPNWADGFLIRPKPKAESHFLAAAGIHAGLVLQYSGNIGRQHNVEILLEAMTRLRDEDIRLIFVGDGHKRAVIEQLVGQHKLASVSIHPYQPRDALGDSLAGCDVQVAVLADEMTGLAEPCKFYGMLAAGKPILVICNQASEMARVVTETNCGLVVPPGDLEGLVKAIKSLADSHDQREEMGRRARRVFEEKYTLRSIARQYVNVLEMIQG